MKRNLCLLFLVAVSALHMRAQTPEPVLRERVLPDLVKRADATYAKLTKPDAKYGCRELFTSMLAYATAGTNTTRIAKLLAFSEAMQDTNAAHRAYGNFRWYARDAEVMDYNAVDFCMQHGTLLWKFHRDALDPAVRDRLHALLKRGLRGLVKHRPPTTYTNIALLNASDLILLGETLGDASAAAEGERRLELFIETLWEEGAHEYVSPTYYGVDVESMMLLETLAESGKTRDVARAILLHFWTDIALNWFAPAQRLCGAHSRTYDYVYGTGELDQILAATGWLPIDGSFSFSTFTPLYARWQPPGDLWRQSTLRFPRRVEQTWGDFPVCSRTHYLCHDVTLSTAWKAYNGRMDIALAADFPGPRKERLPRLSFIPDGRHDPYGKKAVFDGRTHSKAFHLSPWWAGVQDCADALGVAVYRDTDFKDATGTLESHLLFPKRIDALWINDTRIDVNGKEPFSRTVPSGASVFLRKGSAAVAIRVPWSRGQDGSDGRISVVDDGNPFGAARLTVSHVWIDPASNTSFRVQAGVAFWLRVGSDLKSDETFAGFRKAFRSAPAKIAVTPTSLHVQVAGLGQPLSVDAQAPFTGDPVTSPYPPRMTLALDGQNVGQSVLEKCPVVRNYLKNRRAVPTIQVSAETTTEWEAERSGFTVPFEAATNDASASGHAYLWVPEVEGQSSGSGDGQATYALAVRAAGRYTLSGRMLTPTPDDDSFFISVRASDGRELVPKTVWSPGVHKTWTWCDFADPGKRQPAPIDLPCGTVQLILSPREAGSKIDRFRLTPLK